VLRPYVVALYCTHLHSPTCSAQNNSSFFPFFLSSGHRTASSQQSAVSTRTSANPSCVPALLCDAQVAHPVVGRRAEPCPRRPSWALGVQLLPWECSRFKATPHFQNRKKNTPTTALRSPPALSVQIHNPNGAEHASMTGTRHFSRGLTTPGSQPSLLIPFPSPPVPFLLSAPSPFPTPSA
jgi:hypothetical protein